jgi:hypothetical protein
MHLKIQKLNNQIYNKALDFFSEVFIDKLKSKSTFKESLVARYLIEKNKNKFSCISHKKDLVFVWTSDKKIWVDIEVYRERDLNLLDKFSEDEYEILWWKNWESFYILWTAKESILKLENLKLDNIWKIKLIKKEVILEKISEIKFQKKLFFEYFWKFFIILNWFDIDKDICYSITN